MHHIQRSIILSLARTSPLRFTDLQPPRVPNNTFSYHLKKLIDCGYVEVTHSGYVATRKALKLTFFGAGTNKTASSPKLISIIYIENSEGEVLLVNRNHKPFQGLLGLPLGLVHQDESLDQAAIREMYEKTTIATENELTKAGVLEVRYVDQATQDVFVHTVGFIYKYEFTGDKKILNNKVTRYGKLCWSNLDRDDILEEVRVVQNLVNKKQFTYESASFEEPTQLPTPPAKIRTAKQLRSQSAARTL